MIPTVVRSDETLRAIAERMRVAAARDPVTVDLTETKSTVEAAVRSAPVRAAILSSDRVQCLVFGPSLWVSAMLTVDAAKEPKRWHLSLSKIVGAGTSFARATRLEDEAIAKRVADIILPGAVEGEPGRAVPIRSFFAPYQGPAVVSVVYACADCSRSFCLNLAGRETLGEHHILLGCNDGCSSDDGGAVHTCGPCCGRSAAALPPVNDGRDFTHAGQADYGLRPHIPAPALSRTQELLSSWHGFLVHCATHGGCNHTH